LTPLPGPAILGENADLAKALIAFHNAPGDAAPLEAFLSRHPDSRWKASLELDLGIYFLGKGMWSKTIPVWENSWALTKSATTFQLKAIADRSMGELATMHARLGHFERLQSIFEEIKGRDVRGPGSEMVNETRAGLWLMVNKPEEAFRCGPMALKQFYGALCPGKPAPLELVNFKSTSKGTNMEGILAYAEKIGLPCQVAYRNKGSAVLVPAIVNWKVEHYAAITRGLQGEYVTQDLTFGKDCLISKETLDAEASGYFIVRRGPLPSGWRSVSVDEARKVYGRGYTGPGGPPPGGCNGNGAGGNGGGNGGGPPGPGAAGGNGGGGGGGRGPGGGGHGPGCGGPSTPMTTYDFDPTSISLQMRDTPVRYEPPVGEAIWFTATYNHRDTTDRSNVSNLGDKWNFPWLSYIQAPSLASTVCYGPGNGQTSYTGYNSTTNSFAPQLLSQDILTIVGTNSYVLNHKDGSKEIYNLADNTTPARVFLTSSVDRYGNAISFAYDAYFRMQTVTDAIGQITVFSYGLSTDPTDPSFYLITKVTDPFGRYASFNYNEFDQLISITDILGLKSSFIYGAGDFISSLTTPYGTYSFANSDTPATGTQSDRWLMATDPMGASEKIEWDNNASLFQDVNAGGHASVAPSGFENDFLNYRTTFYWNKKAMAMAPNDRNQAFLYHWLHAPADTGAMSYILESTKQPLENRVWMLYPNQNNGLLEEGSTDQPSRVARVLDDGTEQNYYYQYNAIDNLTQVIDPMGRETDLTYDPSNLIDVIQVSQKNSSGKDVLASYTYFSNHLPKTYTDASGQTTSYTYNSFGEILTVTDSKNETTTLAYDSSGYLKSITGPVTGATTTFAYDAYGRVGSVTDSDGYSVGVAYDPADRPTKVTYPDGTYNQVIFNLLDPEWTRDRLGQWSLSLYDPLRRLILTRDPLMRKTIYERCVCGALVGIVDPMGNETKWNIDIQSRITQKILPDGTQTVFNYENTTSRVKSVTDANGQTKTFLFNPDNSVDKITYANAINPTAPVSFLFDAVYPRLISMTDGIGTTTYNYNPITATPTLGAGRLASLVGPIANSATSYTYDELGRVVSGAVNGSANQTSLVYDPLGRIVSVSNLLGTFVPSYVGETGRISSLIYPNGQKTNLGYYPNSSGNTSGNGDDRVQQIANLNSNGTNLSGFGYTYDSNGEIQSWGTQLDAAGAQTATFKYDPAQQITSASLPTMIGSPPKAYSYEYDANGNRLLEQVDNSVTSATFNTSNQLLGQGPGGSMTFVGTVSEPGTVTVGGNAAPVDALGNWIASASVTAGANSLPLVATDLNGNIANKTISVNVLGGTRGAVTYDLNGNMLNNGAGQTYIWDAENRLIGITQSGGVTGFVYNGLGQRVQETLNGTVIKQWIWSSGAQPVEERDASGNVTKRFYGSLGEQIGSNSYFFTVDHLGSVREMTDQAGTVHARYAYDPYGRISKLSGDMDADFGYTGDYYHAASGLFLTEFRAYDPSIGRWLSRDPIGESGSINLYGYVGNDPLNWIDSLGLCPAGIQAAVQYAIGQLGGGGGGGKSGTGGQGGPSTMVQVGDNNFARIPNPQPLNTSNWHRAPSSHSLNTLESPNLPGTEGYALKLYYDPAEGGNIIAVVHQTNTLAHYGDFILYEAGYPVNSSIASQYLKDNGQRDPCAN